MATGFFEADGSGDLQQIATLTGEVDMWFELDGSGDIQPRAAAAEPNFPASGSVRLNVAYGYSLEYTGNDQAAGTSHVQLDYQYGAGGTEFVGVLVSSGTDVPSTPVLDVVNGGTSNAVADISGADASTINTVFHQPWAGGTWVQDGYRTDDGTVAFAIAPGAYWFRAESANLYATAQSNLVFQTITGTSNPLQWQILEAMRDQINAANLTGGNGSAVTARIAWPPEWGTWTSAQVFVMPDSETVEPMMTGVDTLTLGVNVVLAEASQNGTDLTRQMDLRKSLHNLFVGKRLNSLRQVWCQALTESKVFSESALMEFQGVYPLTFAMQTRVART